MICTVVPLSVFTRVASNDSFCIACTCSTLVDNLSVSVEDSSDNSSSEGILDFLYFEKTVPGSS